MIDEALWLDPDAYYTGAIDADLSGHPDPFEATRAIFAFTTEAQTSDRAAMRTRWADYRGKVPPDLAKAIIDDIEALMRSIMARKVARQEVKGA